MGGRKQPGQKIKKGSNVLGRQLIKNGRTRSAKRVNRKQFAGVHVTEEASHLDKQKLESIVQRNDLDEFLTNALLAGGDFAVEKQHMVILEQDAIVPLADKRPELYDYETIPMPRRPKWTKETTGEQLELSEREVFLNWRRDLSVMEANADTMKVTPFEKNLDIWRQLWRVVERSDLVCQIVDARNTLLFRCKDLERYVAEVSPTKKCLLIINKADYLSNKMRAMWATYLQSVGVDFVFFSAFKSQKRLDREARAERQAAKDDIKEAEARRLARILAGLKEQDPNHLDDAEDEGDANGDASPDEEASVRSESAQWRTDKTKVLSRNELLEVFLSYGEAAASDAPNGRRLTKQLSVGMVGYPNVGKSSTINVLCATKKVSVGATPGKTKHFQTLVLDEDLFLCDCPGLVFPTFLNSSAALVCNGILPIDQMRDYFAPVDLLVSRVSRQQLAQVYSLSFPDYKAVTGKDLLNSHAMMRGFMGDSGNPYLDRSARILLKDFVSGKLLYCHPPPGLSTEERQAFADSVVLEQKNAEGTLGPTAAASVGAQAGDKDAVPVSVLNVRTTINQPFDIVDDFHQELDLIAPTNEAPDLSTMTKAQRRKHLKQQAKPKGKLRRRQKQMKKKGGGGKAAGAHVFSAAPLGLSDRTAPRGEAR